jgi:hypothetical protein
MGVDLCISSSENSEAEGPVLMHEYLAFAECLPCDRQVNKPFLPLSCWRWKVENYTRVKVL